MTQQIITSRERLDRIESILRIDGKPGFARISPDGFRLNVYHYRGETYRVYTDPNQDVRYIRNLDTNELFLREKE